MAREAAEADRRRRPAERPRARRPRLIAYFDTTAFLKLVVPERGAALVAETWLAVDRRVSSLLLYPETRAAVRRARRMGRLASSQAAATHRRIESLWDAIDFVAPTEQLARRAGNLAEEHELRAYDAVHLASLEDVGGPETLLVSADVALLEAARAEGFPTVAAL